jgi:hypothetical protein
MKYGKTGRGISLSGGNGAKKKRISLRSKGVADSEFPLERTRTAGECRGGSCCVLGKLN